MTDALTITRTFPAPRELVYHDMEMVLAANKPRP
jgi:hypothetical protein